MFKAYLYQLEKYYQMECSENENLRNEIKAMFPLSTYKSLAYIVAFSTLQPQFSPEILEVYVYQLLYASHFISSTIKSYITTSIIKCLT